jgi:hypothetical protein
VQTRLIKGIWLTLALFIALVPVVLISQSWFTPTVSSPSQLQKTNIKLAQKNLARGLKLWLQGEYSSALDSLTLAADLGSAPAQLYLQYGQGWQNTQLNTVKLNTDMDLDKLSWAGPDCLQQILFVTSELRSLSQATDFINRFNSDIRLQGLPICIAPKVVFVPQLLKCDDVAANTRISCDIAPLAANLKEAQFTHLVIFAKQGKANVHNGIMYLDEQDTYDVLIHELAHFAGFIDEYPLSKELAERVCSGIDTPNLVFQQAGQKQPDLHYWQQQGRSDKVKFTKARTCNNHTAQAFKISSELTFMEYHDLNRIPVSYLAAWTTSLQQNHSITPAFINFAQLYEQQNDVSALYWRQRYQTFHQQP